MEFRVSVRWAVLGMVWAGQMLTSWAAEPPAWETWQRGEWKAFVLEDPVAAEAFIDERFPLELSKNGGAVVNMAYALGLANYLKGQHASSIHWYELALNRPELKHRRTPWEDERAALGMESALWNNLGVNFEIIGEFAKAESALGESRRIDLELGEVRGAWTTAINQGLCQVRVHGVNPRVCQELARGHGVCQVNVHLMGAIGHSTSFGPPPIARQIRVERVRFSTHSPSSCVVDSGCRSSIWDVPHAFHKTVLQDDGQVRTPRAEVLEFYPRF